MPKKEVAERVQRAANILQIEDYLKRKPRALSGGQRQRVAMGRAIVREPQAFLMDEPLSNLDAKLRVQMRAEIHQLQRRLDVTTIYVTHDQVEAMTMGDRVAVMNAGRLQQVDTPQVLYDQPVNEFVAGFIGSPAINLVEAQAGAEQRALGGRLRRPSPDRRRSASRETARRLSDYVGKASHPRHPARRLRGREHRVGRPARSRALQGHLQPDGAARRRRCSSTSAPAPPASSRAPPPPMPARTRTSASAAATAKARTRHVSSRASALARRIAEGSAIELAVDTSRLYFFDPETGGAV